MKTTCFHVLSTHNKTMIISYHVYYVDFINDCSELCLYNYEDSLG